MNKKEKPFIHCMGGFFMLRKWKKYGCIAFLIVALPYVITIFINGPTRFSPPGEKEKEVAVQRPDEKQILTVSLDAYGMGILAKEISMEMDIETIKAQAVIVRTGIYKKITEQNEKDELIFTDPFYTVDEMERVWKTKMQTYYKKLSEAWEETKERILVYEEKPAYTPYCRLTNGKTRDAKEALGTDQYPYLKSVDCEADRDAEGANQSKEIDAAGYEIIKQDQAGYVLEIRKGETIMDGDAFRDEWDLVSSCYTLQQGEKKTTVLTRGIGHGLGMSQNTAERMAGEGKNYKEILNYFFEGTVLKEVAEILGNTE